MISISFWIAVSVTDYNFTALTITFSDDRTTQLAATKNRQI